MSQTPQNDRFLLLKKSRPIPQNVRQYLFCTSQCTSHRIFSHNPPLVPILFQTIQENTHNYIKVRDETPLFEQQRLGRLAHGTSVKINIWVNFRYTKVNKREQVNCVISPWLQ